MGRRLNHRQRGYSLIEIAVVIGVVVSLIATVLVFWQQAENSRKVQRLRSDVLRLIEVIHANYPTGSPNGFQGLTATQLAPSLAGTMEFDERHELFQTTLGTTISTTVTPYTWSVPNESNRAVRLTLQGVPRNVCTELVMDLRGRVTAVAVVFSAIYVHQPGSADASVATIANYCSAFSQSAPIFLYIT